MTPMLWRLRAFPDFCEPCLPSPVEQPPAGSNESHFCLFSQRSTLARATAIALSRDPSKVAAVGSVLPG
jgi:hypothetical protein